MSTAESPAESVAKPEIPRLAFEQLDTLVRVTNVQAWVSLGTLIVICASAMIFAVFYRVPKKVLGEGILLIEKDRLAQVRAPATGRLLRITAALGQKVTPGMELGEISQDDLRDAIQETEARQGELRIEDEKLTEFEKNESLTQEAAIARLKDAITRAMESYKDGLLVASQIVKGSERLQARNQLSLLDLLVSLEKRYDIQNNLNNGQSRLSELQLTKVTSDNNRRKAQLQRQLEIRKLETRLKLDRDKLKRNSRILALVPGKVTQILSAENELVREGSPVVLLSSPRTSLGTDEEGISYESIIFVPAGEGKKIKKDYDVEITPATIKREEHGFIRGHVVAISELPATRLAMDAALQHPDLVENFLKHHSPGVLLRLHVRLEEWVDNPGAHPIPTEGDWNRFLWSSSSGWRQRLTTGTMCEAAIVVERPPLVSLIIPWTKRLFGLD